ncbi:hypothetical protein [Hymenobacter volaticus]|uniref:Uncharacterized protein n=1 Tax=Hymenobacter volaticus TaxID=2932254 RepID=A0ABY4GF05_9BACT|nr:hypothetical protein [Hymenobacter volaticus]UOQ69380.1 hypothetical protein MUN86_27195 [Hymenobacter volaticus]
MLQPKNLLMKREALLDREPRVDQKVFAAIGFPDFTAGISVVFSGCCPATVSDSETVFLCPLRSLTVVPQLIAASPDANTRSAKGGGCPSAPAHPGRRFPRQREGQIRLHLFVLAS